MYSVEHVIEYIFSSSGHLILIQYYAFIYVNYLKNYLCMQYTWLITIHSTTFQRYNRTGSSSYSCGIILTVIDCNLGLVASSQTTTEAGFCSHMITTCNLHSQFLAYDDHMMSCLMTAWDSLPPELPELLL